MIMSYLLLTIVIGLTLAGLYGVARLLSYAIKGAGVHLWYWWVILIIMPSVGLALAAALFFGVCLPIWSGNLTPTVGY